MTATPRTILTSLVLLALGAMGAYLLLTSAPQTEPTERERATRLVQTIEIVPRSEDVMVIGYGNVIPSRSLTLQTEVSGRIVAHHAAFAPGGLVTAGEELLSIDRTDYEHALAEQQAAREEALFELAVEEGRQAVAAREWDELKDELPKDQINEALVLRAPHLQRAKALVAKADNAVARAELDLTRTSIPVPFNAMVLEESIEVGQLVKAGETIATLAGTDSFWVRVVLSLADLQRIELPVAGRPGTPAKVVLETGGDSEVVWRGEVTRLLGDHETSDRLARLLVTVSDPLRLGEEGAGLPLLLGSYVRIEIEAGRLENVLEIPRAALREGDRVWLVGDDHMLRIRDAEILWRRKESVLIANLLQADERLVVSELKAALPGLEVSPQTLDESAAPNQGAGAEKPAEPNPAP
jgi:RND family efflux transporter MFP subunit